MLKDTRNAGRQGRKPRVGALMSERKCQVIGCPNEAEYELRPNIALLDTITARVLLCREHIVRALTIDGEAPSLEEIERCKIAE